MTDIDVRPGDSPSSTLSIVRVHDGILDVLVLGDSPVILGSQRDWTRVTDTRLDELGLAPRRAYQQRLREGSGFDDHHRHLLIELQRMQRARRNTAGGCVARSGLVVRVRVRRGRLSAVLRALLGRSGPASDQRVAMRVPRATPLGCTAR